MHINNSRITNKTCWDTGKKFYWLMIIVYFYEPLGGLLKYQFGDYLSERFIDPHPLPIFNFGKWHRFRLFSTKFTKNCFALFRQIIWVCPRKRFLDPPPPPIHLYVISAKLFIFIFYYFRVRIGQFLGRALQLGQARWPSAAATG